jgi:hypothetical protein
VLKFLKGLFGKSDAIGKTAAIIDQAVTDTDLANTLKAKLIEAELTGSKAQRNWRPHLMYVMMFLLIWIVVIIPISEVYFGVKVPIKEYLAAVPQQLWTLLTVTTTGYIGLRSFVDKKKDK